MAETTNLGLNKPTYNEPVDIEVINANSDKIDAQFVKQADGTVKAAKAVNAENAGKLNNKAENALSVASAKNADTVDNLHASSFASSRAFQYSPAYKGETAIIVSREVGGTTDTNMITCWGEAGMGGMWLQSKGRVRVLDMVQGSGIIEYGQAVQVSSETTKENIQPYNDALNKLLALNVCEYDRKDTDIHQIGIIVEDVNTPEEIIVRGNKDPENPTPDGIDVNSYMSLIVRGLQEHYSKRETEITDAQIALTSTYEAMEEQNTQMQLALCEAYEQMLGVA